MKKEKPIAGNTRDGRLYTTGFPNKYVGDRRTKTGKFETAEFFGSKDSVIAQWTTWRDETLKEASIRIERPRRRSTEVATQKTEKKRVMYVLTFKGQRSQKDVALFESDDAAIRMVDALTAALDATGVDGEYDVMELPVWE